VLGRFLLKTLEAWYGVPSDRDEPVVQLFLANNGPQIGEVRLAEGKLVLEVFPSTEGASWVLPVEELREVIRIAETRLKPQNVPIAETK
jgi:hypothetical protein